MKRILCAVLVLLMLVPLAVTFTACTDPTVEPGITINADEFSYETYKDSTYNDYSYNKNLYYLNELNFEIADPTVIYVEEGEEKGYFYAYGTSDLIQCHGIQCWRSRDLTNWEYRGVAFEPDYSEAWAHNNYWAPELLYDDGAYYMFYSAYNLNDGNQMYMSVAVSQNPYGPFVSPDGMTNLDGMALTASEPVYDFSDNLPGREGTENHTIDIHPFVDPVTGDKYLYFSAFQNWGGRAYQEIYGCKMKDWFTPDYTTLKQLTSIFNSTVEDFKDEMAGGSIQFGDTDEGQDEGATVNEGPFVYYHNGTYYMTYSVYPYTSASYQVRQAVSNSPLGDYEKVSEDKGGTLLATESEWEKIQSAGHHCFIKCGDSLMIAYHTFYDRRSIEEGRALAVDEIHFVKNSDGLEVMHTNGPTYSLQPLPGAISGYYNIAGDGKLTASSVAEGSDVAHLTDGLIKVHRDDLVSEYETATVSETTMATLNLKYDDWHNVRAIMLYNSLFYDMTAAKLSYVKLNVKTEAGDTWVEAKDVMFNYEWNSDSRSTMYPGGAFILEFAEMPVNEIEIGIVLSKSIPSIALGELVVLGNKTANPIAVKEFVPYSYENPADVEFIKYPESDKVGTVGDFHTTWGYGDLSTDDGSADAYIENTAPGDQFAFFKGAEGYNFYFEAELTITEEKPYTLISGAPENYPKFGLVLKSNGGSTFLYIDSAYTGGFAKKQIGYTQRKHDNSDYDWGATEQVRPWNISYTNGDYTKLAIARMGDTYYFFVDDVLFATETGLRGLSGEDVVGGCLSFNLGIRLKNYNVINGESAVKDKVQSLGVTLN